MITEYWNKLIMPSIFVTLEIVFFTVLIGFVLGFIMAILLTLYGPTGLRYKKRLYAVLPGRKPSGTGAECFQL